MTPPLDVGNVLTCTLSGYAHNTTHYFAITSYDVTGNESTFSAEVHKLMTVTVLQLLRTVK